jgi:PBSX family phage portal protein
VAWKNRNFGFSLLELDIKFNKYAPNSIALNARPGARAGTTAGEVHTLGQGRLAVHSPGLKEEYEFEPGTVFHLLEADLHQEVYGLPEWISALQSALLNESATLFRRKYYENGSHAGFILYMTDAAQNEADVDSLRKALKDSKGPGNFRNLFVYSPNGKKDGLQIIPVSEVTAKDEFNSIKNQTRDDVLASLRIPPQLMGIVPQNAGGFGSIREAAQIYAANELEPIQARMAQVNEWLGEEVVRFKPYEIPVGA